MKRYLSIIFIFVNFIFFVLGFSNKIYGQMSEGPRFKGFSSKVTGDIYGQVKVFEDVDGDGKADLIFGATDGQIHIFSSNGNEIIRPPNWPKKTNAPIISEVTVADVDNDGKLDILATTMNGKLYCLNRDGKEKWSVQLKGKIKLTPPEVSKVSNEGEYNIFVGTGVAGTKSGLIYRIDKSGNIIWEISTTSTISGKVIASDLDGNGEKEILTKDDSGKVYVLGLNGIMKKGWPVSTAPNLSWPFDVGTGDLDGDGIQEVFTTTPDKKLIVWNKNGEVRSEVKLTDGSHTAPKLADLNGDGKDEFIIAQADGVIMVCDEKGNPLHGWPYKTKHCLYHTPIVIDINGDGSLDLVFTAWNPEGVGKEAGYVMALAKDGTIIPGFPKYTGKTIAPPTFADLDGDGYLEMIVAGGINYTDNQLHVFPTHAKIAIKLAVLCTAAEIE